MTGCVLGEVERGDDRKHDCCYDIVLYEGNLYKGLRTKRLISQNGNSVPCHFSDASLFRPRSYADSSSGGATGGVQPEESAYGREDGTMERRRYGPEVGVRMDIRVTS